MTQNTHALGRVGIFDAVVASLTGHEQHSSTQMWPPEGCDLCVSKEPGRGSGKSLFQGKSLQMRILEEDLGASSNGVEFLPWS